MAAQNRSRAIVVVVAATVLVACGSAGDSATTPATSATPSTAAATATPSAAPSAPDEVPWAVVGGGPLPVPGFFVSDVAATEDIVVAVGGLTSTENPGTEAPGFWWASQTVAWQAGTVNPDSSGWPKSVTVTADGFVAVGWDGCPGLWEYYNPVECTPAAWTSADGATWERHEVGPATGILSRVVAWEGGLLAIGSRNADPAPRMIAPESFVMRSDDGVAWTAVDPGSAFVGATLTDLATDGTTLIAAGFVEPGAEQPPTPVAAWTSDDGVEWSRQPLPGEAQPIEVSVAFTPTGFVAIGLDIGYMGSELRPMSWASVGGEWEALEIDIGRERALSDVASCPAGVLAVGAGSDAGTVNPRLHGSLDGATWEQVGVSGEVPATFWPFSVSWHAGRLFLGGIVDADEGSHGLILAGLPRLAPSTAP
jgi:hypothetical protein